MLVLPLSIPRHAMTSYQSERESTRRRLLSLRRRQRRRAVILLRRRLLGQSRMGLKILSRWPVRLRLSATVWRAG